MHRSCTQQHRIQPFRNRPGAVHRFCTVRLVSLCDVVVNGYRLRPVQRQPELLHWPLGLPYYLQIRANSPRLAGSTCSSRYVTLNSTNRTRRLCCNQVRLDVCNVWHFGFCTENITYILMNQCIIRITDVRLGFTRWTSMSGTCARARDVLDAVRMRASAYCVPCRSYNSSGELGIPWLGVEVVGIKLYKVTLTL